MKIIYMVNPPHLYDYILRKQIWTKMTKIKNLRVKIIKKEDTFGDFVKVT